MTGSSSRGSSGAGGGSTSPEYCSTLSFESIVNSPDPLVVQKSWDSYFGTVDVASDDFMSERAITVGKS